MEAFVRDLAVPHFLIICSRDCLTRLAVSQGMIDSSNSLRKCRSRSDHPDLRAVFLVGQADCAVATRVGGNHNCVDTRTSVDFPSDDWWRSASCLQLRLINSYNFGCVVGRKRRASSVAFMNFSPLRLDLKWQGEGEQGGQSTSPGLYFQYFAHR